MSTIRARERRQPSQAFVQGFEVRALGRWECSCERVDKKPRRSKACSTMKNLSSNVVASFLALAVTAGVAPVAASSVHDAQPQCGDDKKESKGGDKKDDKSTEPKPKPPVQG